MVPFNLNVLAKFGYCSNYSQKLDESSFARARKMFATARMLGFSLKFPYGKTEKPWAKSATTMNVSGNMHLRFADVVLKLTRVTIFLERRRQR